VSLQRCLVGGWACMEWLYRDALWEGERVWGVFTEMSCESLGLIHVAPWRVLKKILMILIMKANEMHYFLNLVIKYSTCFGQVHCPSSSVSQHCIHTISICRSSSVGLCWQTPKELTWQIPIAVYTVLRYCWWWTVDLSETCRVLYH